MGLLQNIRNTISRLAGSLIGGTSPVLVLDISHYQGLIDPELWGGWVKFVVVKFSEKYYPDPSAHQHARTLLGHYKKIGAYHFLKAGSGALQADFFWNMVQEYVECKQIGLLVIDWEFHPDGTWPSLQDMKDCYYRLLQLAGNIEIQIYTRKTFIDGIPGGAAWLASTGASLMIAHYLSLSNQDLPWEQAYALLERNRFAPWIPAGCKAAIHQITGDRLGCPGVWVDSTKRSLSRLDISFTDPASAARWSGADEPPPPPKPAFNYYFPWISK